MPAQKPFMTVLAVWAGDADMLVMLVVHAMGEDSSQRLQDAGL